MDGILMVWDMVRKASLDAYDALVVAMASAVTTIGGGKVYLVVPPNSSSLNVEWGMSELAAAGADLAHVKLIPAFTDSIWIRDYGPRFIYEGNVRAIVDHTYNRPLRRRDDAFPPVLGSDEGWRVYRMPLVHGGGNFQLNDLGQGFMTRLIWRENPGVEAEDIAGLVRDYYNVTPQFFPSFPRAVDSTQHIDMWMQVISSDTIVVSDWPLNRGSVEDHICNRAARRLRQEGFKVFRTPAVRVRNQEGGRRNHYTYTNVVLFNDIVMIPWYDFASLPHAPGVSEALNEQAVMIYREALPGRTIVPIPGAEALAPLAGGLHCIMSHVPVAAGREQPTVFLRSPRHGGLLSAGTKVVIDWSADDDEAVVSVDVLLSTDGGHTFPNVIATEAPADGSLTWTLPPIAAESARVRVLARDADGHTGYDESLDFGWVAP